MDVQHAAFSLSLHTYQPVTLAKGEIHVKKRVILYKRVKSESHTRCVICYTTWLCLRFSRVSSLKHGCEFYRCSQVCFVQIYLYTLLGECVVAVAVCAHARAHTHAVLLR